MYSKYSKLASFSQISGLDRIAMEEAGIDILQMMEMAGNKFALVVKNYFKDLKDKRILVLAGTGHNGGDGLSAARYLNNWGAKVQVVLAKKDLRPATAHHLEILKKMGVDFDFAPTKLSECDLIIDALLGYNLQGDPKMPYDDLINQANSLETIFAFDNPSGLNIENGDPSSPTIKARATITLAVVKKGLVEEKAKEYVGDLYLVDLGLPRWIYEEIGLEYPFAETKINKVNLIY